MLSTEEYKSRLAALSDAVGTLSVMDLSSMLGELFCAYVATHAAANSELTDEMLEGFYQEVTAMYILNTKSQMGYLVADIRKLRAKK